MKEIAEDHSLLSSAAASAAQKVIPWEKFSLPGQAEAYASGESPSSSGRCGRSSVPSSSASRSSRPAAIPGSWPRSRRRGRCRCSSAISRSGFRPGLPVGRLPQETVRRGARVPVPLDRRAEGRARGGARRQQDRGVLAAADLHPVRHSARAAQEEALVNSFRRLRLSVSRSDWRAPSRPQAGELHWSSVDVQGAPGRRGRAPRRRATGDGLHRRLERGERVSGSLPGRRSASSPSRRIERRTGRRGSFRRGTCPRWTSSPGPPTRRCAGAAGSRPTRPSTTDRDRLRARLAPCTGSS